MKTELVTIYIIKSPNREHAIDANTFIGSTTMDFAIKEVAAIFPKKDNGFGNFSQKFLKNYKRTAMLGEYGCLLSHASIWSDIEINKNAVSIVLEDDAEIVPSKGLEYLLKFMNSQHHSTIVRLGKSKVLKEDVQRLSNKKPGSVIARKGSSKIIKEWFLNTDGTVGYVLNLEAAVVLSNLRHVEDGRLVDDWKFAENKGICVYQFKPFLIYEKTSMSTICNVDDIRVGLNNRTRGYLKYCLTVVSRIVNLLRGFGFTN